jgi:hypothetical protein
MIAGMLETTSATVWHDFSLKVDFVPDLFLSNLKLFDYDDIGRSD